MAEYISDDDEFEKFKRWWNESGQQLLLGIVIAASGYFGWQFWQDSQQQKAEAGFVVYEQLLELAQQSGELDEKQQALLTHHAVTLKSDYADTQYAYYASLILASQAVARGDLELAANELQTVVDSADEGLSLMARLRLARVEAQRQGADTALALLAVADAKTFSSSYAEARGDFYLLKGEKGAAREAFQEALQLLASDEQQYRGVLETKLSQVALGDETDVVEARPEEQIEQGIENKAEEKAE